MIGQEDSTLSEVSWQLVIIPQELTHCDLTVTLIRNFDFQVDEEELNEEFTD